MLDYAHRPNTQSADGDRAPAAARGTGATTVAQPIFRSVADRQFACLQTAFARHGGMATGEDITVRLRRRSDQPISVLARWIVSRSIVNVTRASETLIPVFQFDLPTMTILPGVSKVVLELCSVFDDWELALWFAEPNLWLQDASPVDVLSENPEAVFQAARADRFVARG